MGIASPIFAGGGGGGGGGMGLRGRQPSSTTIASSMSGAGTPEIPERIPPYLANSATPSPRPFGREYSHEERRRYPQFSPSTHSAFSRLPVLEDDDEEETRERVGLSRQRLFDGRPLGVGGATGRLGYPTPPPRAATSSLSPVEALWERQRSLAERKALAETDEETAQEEDEARDRFHYRRGSLPVRPLAHYHGSDQPDHWNFKTREKLFPNIPIGRVSPLMSDHEHSGGGRGVVKKLAAQREQDDLGVSRASTGTPPDKPSNATGDFHSQTHRNGENIQESEEKGEEREEGESVSDVEEEEEEEREVEGATGLQNWEEAVEDVENGAKAVHVEDTRHPTPPLPLIPAGVLPSPSSPARTTTSTSTPNSLTRQKPSITSRAKQRAPSVPALPTSLLASSTDQSGLPVGLPECLGNYERTLHNARNYMREFKALAESGSSDQESDPEPSRATDLKAAELMEQISSAAKVPALIHHHLVTLHKENKDTDLGFSLSDGFGEPGVYVKSIHSGGLAEENGELEPFDRIMKVGLTTSTHTHTHTHTHTPLLICVAVSM